MNCKEIENLFTLNDPLGFKWQLNESPEPTDIMWEYWNVRDRTKRRKKTVFAIKLIFWLFVSLTVIFIATKFQLRATTMYPPEEHCMEVSAKYGDSLQGFAYDDYVQN